ncbi:PEP-CTERM sorting domain-containing protein [Desulfonatronum thiodismutans]|uniref:PEP-CTERM sorting domain-containing protein n=1 Tax=Desulfonatronum thiodismutans TaxID=159290 RepID=UPI0004ABDB4E|nr:PEP-CTERM sorting domain-containing protein [Desulfonatronum thiodismutans]
MKRLLTLFLAAMFLSGMLMVGNAHALSLSLGPVKFVLDGESYFTETANGELKGLLQANSIIQPVNQFKYVYGQGGVYYNVVFEALTPIEGFDPELAGSIGYFTGGSVKIYENNTGPLNTHFDNDIAAGPSAATFANNIIANGTLMLDLSFAPGFFPEFSGFPGTYQSQVAEKAVSDSDLTGLKIANLGYLTINSVGAAWEGIFDKDIYVSASNATADVLLQGNAKYTGTENGWDTFENTSFDVQAGIVPEPGTMLLLGAGLLGLAGYARVRRKNKA